MTFSTRQPNLVRTILSCLIVSLLLPAFSFAGDKPTVRSRARSAATGRAPTSGRSTRGRTTKVARKRALIVLLENDGMAFVLSQLKQLQGVELPKLPYMCFNGRAGKLELKLNKNENIPQAIARLRKTIERTARQCAGKAPKAPKKPRVPYLASPPAPPKTPNPTDPRFLKAMERYTKNMASYTKKLAQYNARVAANLTEFLNPSKWSVKETTMTEAVDAVSDFFLEELTKGIQLAQNTQGAYDKVVVLEDKSVRADIVLSQIRRLARGYTIDMHILTHGGDNTIYGYQEGKKHHVLTPENFFQPLMSEVASGRCPLDLRAVYQMNCSSGSLKDDWKALGARVVNGTEGVVVNYMPHQYFHFMDRWIRRGESFEQASLRSHQDVKDSTEFVYKVFLDDATELVRGSRLTVVGNGRLRLKSR